MIKDLCRIGSDMSKKRWKLWAIPGFLGLLALTMLTRCNPIEDDLQQRSQTLLTDQGMGWAKTELDGRGRDLLLTGIAPSEDAKNKAINLTQGVYGVRTVDHDITVKEYVSSVFKLNHSDNKVTLAGSLPDQSSIDLAVNKAQSLYGEANVVNNLSINEMAKKPAWLAGAAGLMAALYGADNLAMDATDSHVNISGTVGSEDAKTQLLQQAQASFGDQFSESIKVVQVGPTAEELAAIEAARIAEEQRLAAEAEAARLAEEQRLAAEAEAARLAEEKRLEKQNREMLAYCQLKLNELVNTNPPVFMNDSTMILGSGYGVLGMITLHVNSCSALLHKNNQYIDVVSQAGTNETSPQSSEMGLARAQAITSYLENINGIHPGLLRPRENTSTDSIGNSQLHFTITE